MQRRFRAFIVAAVVLFVTILIVALPRRPSGPKVVARSVAPNGVEMYLVQKSNWGNWTNLRRFLDDPWFTTRFICRTADGVWQSYYYSHEDTFWWGRSRFVLDTNASLAVLYRGKDAVIRFQWNTGSYQIIRPYADGTARSPQTVAPESVPSGWMPVTSSQQQ